MREAIHASPNFNVDITVFSDFAGEFVMTYDIVRQIADKVTKDGYVYVEIRRGMYRLPQARLIAQKLPDQRLIL